MRVRMLNPSNGENLYRPRSFYESHDCQELEVFKSKHPCYFLILLQEDYAFEVSASTEDFLWLFKRVQLLTSDVKLPSMWIGTLNLTLELDSLVCYF